MQRGLVSLFALVSSLPMCPQNINWWYMFTLISFADVIFKRREYIYQRLKTFLAHQNLFFSIHDLVCLLDREKKKKPAAAPYTIVLFSRLDHLEMDSGRHFLHLLSLQDAVQWVLRCLPELPHLESTCWEQVQGIYLDTYAWESANSGQFAERRVVTWRSLCTLQWAPENRPTPVFAMPLCHGGLESDQHGSTLRTSWANYSMPPLRSFLGGRTQQKKFQCKAKKIQWLGDLHLLEFIKREKYDNF